jgi:cob(I)alamin adenosyltransferase
MKIYTRTGDQGKTSLYTGERVAKNDSLISAVGTADECNSSIGVVRACMPKEELFVGIEKQLGIIQHTLFDLGAAIATPRTKASKEKIERTRFDEEGTQLLEQWIDHLDTFLPPLKTFILPGGTLTAAQLHLARSICRRFEREIIPLSDHHDVSIHVIPYLNRLGDYLFSAARAVNYLAKESEILWEKHKASSNLG